MQDYTTLGHIETPQWPYVMMVMILSFSYHVLEAIKIYNPENGT